MDAVHLLMTAVGALGSAVALLWRIEMSHHRECKQEHADCEAKREAQWHKIVDLLGGNAEDKNLHLHHHEDA